MIVETPKELRVRQAAFALALQRPWRDIGLADIARNAGMDLAELQAVTSSKSAILRHFSRAIDEAMLLLLRKDPPGGQPHDRLFDVVLKRLEILAPYRMELRHIVTGQPQHAAEYLPLIQTMLGSVNWMLAAAGLENDSRWRGPGFAALLFAYGRTLEVWLNDEDQSLNRTMAALDRELRDAERRASRLVGLQGLGAGLMKATGILFRQIFDKRKVQP